MHLLIYGSSGGHIVYLSEGKKITITRMILRWRFSVNQLLTTN